MKKKLNGTSKHRSLLLPSIGIKVSDVWDELLSSLSRNTKEGQPRGIYKPFSSQRAGWFDHSKRAVGRK